MKFVLRNKSQVRSLLALLMAGNILFYFFFSISFLLFSILFLYNFVSVIILLIVSNRELSISIQKDSIILHRIFSKKIIHNRDINSIETNVYTVKGAPIDVCRLGVKGLFAITFTRDMFKVDHDYDKFIDNLSWIKNRYLEDKNLDYKKNDQARRQLVTFVSAFIILIVYISMYSLGEERSLSLLENFSLPKNIERFDESYKFLSAFFLHLNPPHLLINLLSLGVLGGILEPYLGRYRYFNLLFLSVITGWVFTILFSTHNYIVGASGGVLGLFGAYIVLKIWKKNSLRPSIDPMPFWWITLILSAQFILDIYFKNSSLSTHIGGIVGGVLYMLFAKYLLEKYVSFERSLSLLLVIFCVICLSTLLIL